MTIKVGDTLPAAQFKLVHDGIQDAGTDDVFKDRTVVLFAVPGAFTPTCSARHLPGFVEKADQLKAKGIDTIACVSVNDAFVMDAWGKAQNCAGKVEMLADGNGDFTRALGLEMDATKVGLGQRSKRYSMLVEDGVVKQLNVEQPGAFEVSSAEYMLNRL